MPNGFLQVERAVDSIRVGARHRKELGDIDALAASITALGLLQPITITPDGDLVCGLRRLTAIKQLGWRTTNVWVRSGLSDRMHHLLAEQDENNLRKPFSALEAEELYAELKVLLTEDAARRQGATRFGSSNCVPGERGVDGGPDSGPPQAGSGRTSRQAARMVTGTASHSRMEQIGWLRRIADDTSAPDAAHRAAGEALERISAGHPVDPLYRAVTALAEGRTNHENGDDDKDERARPSEAELDTIALATLERVKRQAKQKRRTPKSHAKAERGKFTVSQEMWVMTFRDLDGWLEDYDPADVAGKAKASEWAAFERALDQFQSWGARARAARKELKKTS